VPWFPPNLPNCTAIRRTKQVKHTATCRTDGKCALNNESALLLEGIVGYCFGHFLK
jgi:hypothetical protein